MIRTVIIDNNLDYSKKILNTILSNFKDIQLMYVATTYKKGINIIKNNLIDLVLIDLKLPDNGGIKIIKQLNSMNNIQKPRIVVISGNYELVSQVNEKDCIIYKLDSFEEAYKKIERIISDINYENNGKEVKRFIASEIFKLGYNISNYICV